MVTPPKPVVLVILDGIGIDPRRRANAYALANTPTLDRLWRDYAHATLEASGEAVGLPAGQMGNSEVGHLNLGAGFVVHQDLTRLGQAIESGEFYRNATLLAQMRLVQQRGTALHLIGLVGPGGVHSHGAHLMALLRMAKAQGLQRVFVHAFLDGRDTPPQSAAATLSELEVGLKELGVGRVASVSGRYYAMDRDNRWDRTTQAYRALVHGVGEKANTAAEAVAASYAAGVTDEFVVPTVVRDGAGPTATIRDGDGVMFFNFRADRARQLTRALVAAEMPQFDRGPARRDLAFVTMTEYEKELPVQVAFPTQDVARPLAEVISRAGLKQFHTAETEKYAHVTFFFNGGREVPFEGEARLLAPSPRVATYDLQPEMSAVEITEGLVQRIRERTDDFVLVNYANGDMVGHTGSLPAAIKAVETVDACLGRVLSAVSEAGGLAFVTADHGNCEVMEDYTTGTPHTAHTTNPVPAIVFHPDFELNPKDTTGGQPLLRSGKLCDVAPTLLGFLGVTPPPEMTGHSLVVPPREH